MVTTVDLMDFVHELRSEFFETAAKLGWEEFTRDRGVSMRSFRERSSSGTYACRRESRRMQDTSRALNTDGGSLRRLHSLSRAAT